MDRLTYWCDNWHGGGKWFVAIDAEGREDYGPHVDRLAAYEETGLEPGEIEQLKGEVFGLRLDKQNLEQVKQKYGEAREAICTHCMDVPCQGESCYWWQGPEEG